MRKLLFARVLSSLSSLRLAAGAVALVAAGGVGRSQEYLFEACGTIVSPGGFCSIAFEVDGGSLILLTNYGGFPIGQRVHVTGVLQNCETTCPTGTCMLGNTIDLCAPCACATYCSGDGTSLPCPCGNPGTSGYGCPSSVASAGAQLWVTGGSSLSQDTIVLYSWSMPNSTSMYVQGTGAVDAPFGDGKLCVGGALNRLAVRTNVNGYSKFPYVGEPRISIVGQVTAPGARYYQTWYRDPTDFCTPGTWNLSNAVSIQWQP